MCLKFWIMLQALMLGHSVVAKNGCLKVSFFCHCTSEFQHEAYIEISTGLTQVQEASVSVESRSLAYLCNFFIAFFCTYQQFKISKNKKALKTVIQ